MVCPIWDCSVTLFQSGFLIKKKCVLTRLLNHEEKTILPSRRKADFASVSFSVLHVLGDNCNSSLALIVWKLKKNYVESMFKEGQHPSHSKSRIRISFFGDPSFPVHMRHMTWLRCPMLLRITKHSLHNKDICKLVNWALRTTYGSQQFAKTLLF